MIKIHTIFQRKILLGRKMQRRELSIVYPFALKCFKLLWPRESRSTKNKGLLNSVDKYFKLNSIVTIIFTHSFMQIVWNRHPSLE